MAIYYTGVLAGNQVNFTTGDVTVVANDVKNYIIDQTVSGGQTGLSPSTRAVFQFTTGVSGYFSGLNTALVNATGTLSSFTGTLGTAAFRDLAATIANNGTGLPTSDVVFDFSTGLSGFLMANATGSAGLTLQQVTNNGNVTTGNINVGGDLVVSGNVTIGNDASDTLTINAGPVVLANATQNSDALVFGANDANRATIYKSDARGLRIDGSLTITGDLLVSGTTTYLNTQTLNVGDNIITLNADYTGATGFENAGIEVNRGGDTTVSVRWNEGTNVWEFTNNGSAFYAIPTGGGGGGGGASYTLDVGAGGSNDALIVITGSDATSDNIIVSGVSGITISEISNQAIVISHADTSAAASVASANANGIVVQSFTGQLDTYGHVTGLSVSTVNLDSRFLQSGSGTLNAVTTNGNSTANAVIVGDLTVSGSANALSDHFVLYASTADATATELFLNGTNGRIVLASNSSVSFRGSISAYDTTNNRSAAWTYDCLIANKGGNTSIIGSALVTRLGDDSSNVWAVFVDGDNATDSLKLLVQGQASTNIKWTASVLSSVVI